MLNMGLSIRIRLVKEKKMRMKLRCAALLLCITGLAGGASAAIIADGDFEAGTAWPDGWLYHGSSALAPGAGVGGSAAGETTADGASVHGLLNVFATEVGGDWGTGEWVMTFDAKNTDGATNVELGLLGPGFADWEVFTLSTDWDTFSGTVTFPVAAQTANGDAFFYQRGAGSVQIDNVSFAAIPEPATMGLIGIFGGGLLFTRRVLKI